MYSLRANILELANAVDDRERRWAECRRRRQARRFTRMNTSPFNDIPEAEFVKTFRLGKDSVRGLIEELIPLMARPRRNDSVSAEIKILIALAFYASGSYQNLIGQSALHNVSQITVSRAINEVTEALNKIYPKYIKWPTQCNERNIIKAKFYQKFEFPGVLGCIDGTHIAILRPHIHEERYYNRKGFHSLNVMIICDADLNILCVDASNPGSAHDSTVWQSHPLSHHLKQITEDTNEQVFLLGDSGYPLRKTMMTPILNTVDGTPQHHYYVKHVTARNTVERCIGVLKARFSPNVETTVLPYADYDEEINSEIEKAINGFDALVWNTKYKLTSKLLDLAGPTLKAITTVSSGLDHVDLDEVKSRGIRLGHCLKVMDNSVADTAVGLMLGAARRFKEGLEEINNGTWRVGIQWTLGLDVSGSTVGVVGLGGIGQAIVRRLKGFEVRRFLYCGRSVKPEAESLGVDRVSLEQLLMKSDFIVLACPLSADTKHLINAKSIKLMKATAVIVNIGRGGLIDHDALYEALKEKRIFAAGLDVVTPEPLPHGHPLALLPNCFIMPHIGSATVNTRRTMGEMAAQNIILALEGKPMLCPVF